jgi:hypothetical protein
MPWLIIEREKEIVLVKQRANRSSFPKKVQLDQSRGLPETQIEFIASRLHTEEMGEKLVSSLVRKRRASLTSLPESTSSVASYDGWRTDNTFCDHRNFREQNHFPRRDYTRRKSL